MGGGQSQSQENVREVTVEKGPSEDGAPPSVIVSIPRAVGSPVIKYLCAAYRSLKISSIIFAARSTLEVARIMEEEEEGSLRTEKTLEKEIYQQKQLLVRKTSLG